MRHRDHRWRKVDATVVWTDFRFMSGDGASAAYSMSKIKRTAHPASATKRTAVCSTTPLASRWLRGIGGARQRR